MSIFDNREETFEKRYVHEQELQFRAEARRNRLFGLWAAEKLGKSGPEAEAYAEALVVAEASANADEQVFSTVKADFAAAGVEQSDHQLRRTLDELLETARLELKQG
ncbi:hypothetical protein MSC49_07870 [Methylosinus sp. C49]|jgi:hypothetical protein|uniref:DUF1476 domain-containing protein n=1 Tax=unclassified Methylosinus TaxID=2624500 RepID=UPI000463A9AC|nr:MULTISPECIES: DUF1476 domain-containing protein [unclassified Methylosinus]OAI22539.1 aldolase [Methylosinus sp. R-45379]TDX66799.1 hypothetical protein EDE12_101335 [Methylosinus sp. sav-2]BBU60852.1 hypothetical protein MSC49_07870 [Methylosinus sp. C49]